jgi:hypothetical protein
LGLVFLVCIYRNFQDFKWGGNGAMAYVDGGKQALEEGMKVDIAVRECNMMDCSKEEDLWWRV